LASAFPSVTAWAFAPRISARNGWAADGPGTWPNSKARVVTLRPYIACRESLVWADRCTFQREPREHTLGTGVGQDLCIHLPIRTGLGMPSNRTRCCRSVRSNVEITLEQLLHPFFILNDHDQVHSLYTDLQSPVSARNSNECGRTPAIRRAAGGYAFASLTSEDKAAFDHVRNNRHALCVLQHFFRDSLVRHSPNFV